jgi:large subunit ribosomal protein L18
MAVAVKQEGRARRRKRVRKRVAGTSGRPRLTVFRSLKHIYAQVIDDSTGRTLVSACSLHEPVRTPNAKGGNVQAAEAIGRLLAERALAKGVEKVVFDRNGYLYHGRVKALADGARAGGLQF